MLNCHDPGPRAGDRPLACGIEGHSRELRARGRGAQPGEVRLGGLTVDKARMRQNLAISKGLIIAEAVMMGVRDQPSSGAYHAVRVTDGVEVAGDPASAGP